MVSAAGGWSVRSNADLLVADTIAPSQETAQAGGLRGRPPCLQEALDCIYNIMLASESTMRAKFTAAKVVHNLSKPGRSRAASAAIATSLTEPFAQALSELSELGTRFKGLAESLRHISSKVDWYPCKTGLFASVNFEHANAQAILVGPGGMEERGDVRIGIMLMAPYTRFPDHTQSRARTFLALSDGEFRIGEGHWTRMGIGSMAFNDAGRGLAIRCTAKPFLAVWCQLER